MRPHVVKAVQQPRAAARVVGVALCDLCAQRHLVPRSLGVVRRRLDHLQVCAGGGGGGAWPGHVGAAAGGRGSRARAPSAAHACTHATSHPNPPPARSRHQRPTAHLHRAAPPGVIVLHQPHSGEVAPPQLLQHCVPPILEGLAHAHGVVPPCPGCGCGVGQRRVAAERKSERAARAASPLPLPPRRHRTRPSCSPRRPPRPSSLPRCCHTSRCRWWTRRGACLCGWGWDGQRWLARTAPPPGAPPSTPPCIPPAPTQISGAPFPAPLTSAAVRPLLLGRAALLGLVVVVGHRARGQGGSAAGGAQCRGVMGGLGRFVPCWRCGPPALLLPLRCERAIG